MLAQYCRRYFAREQFPPRLPAFHGGLFGAVFRGGLRTSFDLQEATAASFLACNASTDAAWWAAAASKSWTDWVRVAISMSFAESFDSTSTTLEPGTTSAQTLSANDFWTTKKKNSRP